MNDDQFSALLAVIVPEVIALIVTRDGLSETDATDHFYSSVTYARLSKEDLKLWHFSAETLYSIFRNERETGEMRFPEEAC